MTITLSILGFGVLFALFGVVQRSRPRCGGNCGGCASACAAEPGQDER
jgi:hypothetical protein